MPTMNKAAADMRRRRCDGQRPLLRGLCDNPTLALVLAPIILILFSICIANTDSTIITPLSPRELPNGIVDSDRVGGEMPSMDSIYLSGTHIKAGKPHQNTFQVEPKHEFIPDVGARFNVESVPSALEKDLSKPTKSRKALFDSLKQDVAKSAENSHSIPPEEIKLEAVFDSKESNLVYTGGDGFLAACLTAFAQHLPLQLAPDDIWALISYAFAKHVDENAEALRKNFVQYQGKKRLEIITPDRFGLTTTENPDESGASAKEWETSIFPEFSRKIRDIIGDTIHDAIAADFSTTNAASKAASEITLMSSVKNYFSFGMSTMCGIPRITLAGSEKDWVALRRRAEDLGELMMPEFSQYWMPLLLPVLDEFVSSYKGQVSHGFWQSMVKLRNNGMGSGYAEFISGWIQILFPYLDSGKNTKLFSWNEMYFHGPDPKEFPAIVSSAPVDWNYHGTKFDLEFRAGIAGFAQDPSDGTLSPVVGWYVNHTPPKPLIKQLKEVKDEIWALLKGHEDEAKAMPVDETQSWFRRISTLRRKQAQLEQDL